MSTNPTSTRPSIANEVRAWIAVGVVLLINLGGGAWWAATLSAEVKSLRELMARLEAQISSMAGVAYTARDARRDQDALQRQLADHETRIRDLERPRSPVRPGGGP